MNLGVLRALVSVIVIFGHLLVFLTAMALGVFSLLGGVDAMQTLLMASPVLAVIAFGAFSNVIENKADPSERTRVSLMYATICVVFPLFLVGLVLALFWLFYQQLDHFGPDQLKITLGGVETFFGVFIGMISKSLFGYAPNSAK
ncbi:hypothetical protein [Mesorhizobium sp. B2-3-5]|uniref:hypothetical protein n=1 Tax=Mesorhizobium sp. B2-3-5 TaxID=2589958 RepID=UPI00112689F4|nr:hypothetical protein [Mesorhizobium sp. B2-3-5]TPM35524.1 hypothetical protein FJ958_06405 [Mesorhizobium sp. B2-3-5]